MKGLASVLLCILLAIVCWGIYGPLLQSGTVQMARNGLAAFLCVGLAYFAIAVVVPVLLLNALGERGRWNAGGIGWSLIAGASGAIGALGVILAMKNGGVRSM